jgi:hypothetical protein
MATDERDHIGFRGAGRQRNLARRVDVVLRTDMHRNTKDRNIVVPKRGYGSGFEAVEGKRLALCLLLARPARQQFSE